MPKISNNAIFNVEIIPYSINKLGNKEELDYDIIWNKKHELKLKKSDFSKSRQWQNTGFQLTDRKSWFAIHFHYFTDLRLFHV